MKILLLNTSERSGGAAVAANRLMVALQKAGHTVHMLVRDKQSLQNEVVTMNNSVFDRILNRFRFLWERLVIFLCNKLSRKNLFQVSLANTGIDISGHPLVKEADIIHLHWINQGFLSLKDIKALIDTGKPIVWTMHDLWPATGICHYPGKCERYQIECYSCPKLVNKPLWNLAGNVFNSKKGIGLSAVTFVGCSEWITRRTQLSGLLRKSDFLSIPNPIDTEVFYPVSKVEARQSLGLPIDKQLLLFAAAKLSDNRKGATYFIEACRLLSEVYAGRIEILLMGSGSEELLDALPFPVNKLGYISDETKMRNVYASADIFVIPSLEDNLPNTIMESMACGTPCVGFETGGIPEMIDHKKNGYIAHYKDAKDLSKGIQWVLSNGGENNELSSFCVEKVKADYNEAKVSAEYLKLYSRLLNK